MTSAGPFSFEGCDPPGYVEQVLREASTRGATDLYWLPSENGYGLRIRISGVQHRVADLPREFGETCMARLKVLGGLLTYRKRIAQDGVMREAGAEVRRYPLADLGEAAERLCADGTVPETERDRLRIPAAG